MESYEAHKTLRSMKRGGVLMLVLGSIFRPFHLTGEQGVALLTTLRDAMWENRESSSGGLMGALTELYGAGEPPHETIDLILAELLPYGNTRGGVCEIVDEIITLLKQGGKTDLTQPWRQCMIQVFAESNKSLKAEQSAMESLKSALNDAPPVPADAVSERTPVDPTSEGA